MHKLKRVQRAVNPRHLTKAFGTRRMIKNFADQLGLVYFGGVDQSSDEHRLVRGITTSNTHRDDHYCVGTFHNYDVALVVRRDGLSYPDKRVKHHEWTILTVDLHTSREVPHIFIAHAKTRELLLAKYSHLVPLMIGYGQPGQQDFWSKYSVLAKLEQFVTVENMLSSEILTAIGTSFGDLAVELHENTIYLYLAKEYPTKVELETMLKNGIWLAERIDQLAQEVLNN